MGKWSKFKSTLQRYVPEGDYQDKIDAVKQELSGKDHAWLGERLGELKLGKRNAEAALKVINLEIEAVGQLLLDWMEAHKLSKIELASGGLVSMKDVPYCSVSNLEALKKWIKDNRMGTLLSVHWQTLNSLVKDALIEGKAVPKGVKVYMKTTVAYRGPNRDEQEEEE